MAITPKKVKSKIKDEESIARAKNLFVKSFLKSSKTKQAEIIFDTIAILNQSILNLEKKIAKLRCLVNEHKHWDGRVG